MSHKRIKVILNHFNLGCCYVIFV